MSKISIEGNASGTGTITIAAPNTNSNATLTLPTASGTVVTTAGAQTIEFAAGTAGAPSITTTGDTNTGIFFPAADTIAFAEGGAEAMRIDSSGNVGVGTTSPSTRLHVYGSAPRTTIESSSNVGGQTLYKNTLATDGFIVGMDGAASGNGVLYHSNAKDIVISTGAVERARITSGGDLLVGTTSGSGNNERVNITSSTTQTARFINTNAGSSCISIVSGLGANTDNTSSYHILTATNGNTRFYVYGNGTYGNASDQNLKKNIETTRDGYIDDLCRLRIVKYNWNEQEDGSPKELGWVAQEVEQVFPGLVQDGVPNENGETFKEVKTSVLPFMLLKAIQELKSITDTQAQTISALEARIAALETGE